MKVSSFFGREMNFKTILTQRRDDTTLKPLPLILTIALSSGFPVFFETIENEPSIVFSKTEIEDSILLMVRISNRINPA
jgi:hypothetical protein